jgi:hypothetical protein
VALFISLLGRTTVAVLDTGAAILVGDFTGLTGTD